MGSHLRQLCLEFQFYFVERVILKTKIIGQAFRLDGKNYQDSKD
jgi:hypothetical protein